MLCRAHHCMIVSCRAHGCIFLSFKRQKITTVGSEQPENITFHGKRQKKSAMGRSVPKRWAQVDFTVNAEMLVQDPTTSPSGTTSNVPRLEFWVRFPNKRREEPGKTGAPCVKVPGSARATIR